jgi:hypothetical protein
VNLERRWAGVSLRVWALVANLAGNILMVYGAAHFFVRGTHIAEMIAGTALTAACVAVLAAPNR